MALINSQTTRYQLDKNFNKLFIEEQSNRPKFYTQLVTAKDAPPGEFIQEGRMTELGLAPQLLEGQRPSFDTPSEGNKVLRYFMKRGLSIQLTEERMMDDIGGTWKQLPKQLVNSIEEAIEYDVANVLELGRTTSLCEDGTYLFGTAAHKLISTGAVPTGSISAALDNLPSSKAALSTTTLQAAIKYGKNMIKDNGFKMPIRFTGIIIHPDDEWTAYDLQKQSGRVWDGTTVAGAANTAAANYAASDYANLVKSGSGVPVLGSGLGAWKVIVNPFLATAGRWFAMFEGFEMPFFWKYRPRLVKDEDIAGTDNLIYTAKARYATYINKYKYIYANGT